MKIKRLYIGDFGIFKNQSLDNLGSNIVVIGGHNRAGKSTFLEILRYLGYGIPKSSKLPKPNVQYLIDSDVRNKEGREYSIRLQGFSEPKVNISGSNGEADIKDLYGSVDFYTYSQLFTITLDELQKVNSKETEKLRTILMGAGFKEIVQIPSIITDLKKEAEKIGGKNGSINIKQFKPYNQKITDCIKIKQDEKRKIDLYYENINALETTEQSIISASKDLEAWQNKLFLLDIIKSSIDKYKIKLKLEEEVQALRKYNKYEYDDISKTFSIEKLDNIRDRYYVIMEKYNEAVYYFKSNIAEDLCTIKSLREVKDNVLNYEKRLPGLREKLQRYMSLKEIYEDEKNKIIRESSLVNENFKGNLNAILNIKCDDLSQDRLLKLSTEHSSLSNEIKQIDSEIEDLSLRKNNLENQAKEIKLNSNSAYIRKYLILSLGIALMGILFSLVNHTAGIGISLVGIGSVVLYTVINYISNNENENKNRSILEELKEIKILIENKNSKLQVLDNKFDNINDEICSYAEKLQLNEDISLEGLRDYLKSVQGIKKDIIILSQRGKNLGMLKEDIINELKSMSEVVLNFQYLRCMEFDSIIKIGNNSDSSNLLKGEYNYIDDKLIEYHQYFLADIDKIIAVCSFLEKYEAILNEKQSMEGIIKNILNTNVIEEDIAIKLDNFIYGYKMFQKYTENEQKLNIVTREILQSFNTDRARNALRGYYNISSQNESVEVLINNIYCEMSSIDMLESDYEISQKKVDEFKLKLDNEKDKRQYLREEIKRLATVEKLEKAQCEIDKSRAELKLLAERYAVSSAAAYILELVQDNFIENAKEIMLKGASEMFKKITNGEYVNISPAEDVATYDYAVTLDDDNIQPSMDFLSRGTAEQLFLSVRLSKINEIEPALPLILDDPFVNFDNLHIEKVMKILVELSRTNQIFVLTCHPQIIAHLREQNADVQYFKLEKGKFSSTDANNLIEYLSK